MTGDQQTYPSTTVDRRKRLKAFLFDIDTWHSALAACANLGFVSDIIIVIIIIIIIIVVALHRAQLVLDG